jgi:hypothetical protein
MKKISISLDEDVARWAHIRAAESDTSVTRLVGELLREKMLNSKSYDNLHGALPLAKTQKTENPVIIRRITKDMVVPPSQSIGEKDCL